MARSTAGGGTRSVQCEATAFAGIVDWALDYNGGFNGSIADDGALALRSTVRVRGHWTYQQCTRNGAPATVCPDRASSTPLILEVVGQADAATGAAVGTIVIMEPALRVQGAGRAP